MDVSQIPAIDAHAHPFSADSQRLTPQVLRDSVSVSLRGTMSQINDTMLLSRYMVRELARFLGCDETFEAAVAARNAAAEDSYPVYVARMFDDAAIDTLLVDHGYPFAPVIEFKDFSSLLPRPPFQGYRIERFFPPRTSSSFHNDAAPRPFDQVLEEFEARLDMAVEQDGCRFYKSVMAYRTGLAIQPVELATARDAWASHTRYGDAAEKLVRDFLFLVTVNKARQHRVPFQLHTGHTSHVNVWPNTNPILLTPILNSGLLDGVTLVLVHGGYPYCAEGGYLTSVYPEVYLDLSLMIPWASAGIVHRIEQTFESAPLGKVMYGSDGINCPEMHWISARLARQALGQVLDRLIQDRFLSASQVEEAAHDIFHRTARRIYQL